MKKFQLIMTIFSRPIHIPRPRGYTYREAFLLCHISFTHQCRWKLEVETQSAQGTRISTTFRYTNTWRFLARQY